MSTPKTLAGMTPEERDQCRGMWCDTRHGTSPRIYAGEGFDEFAHRGLVAKMSTPMSDVFGYVPFDRVTPRFDLPRAWNPDGTPIEGQWLTGKMQIDPEAPGARYDKATNSFYGVAVLNTSLPKDQHNCRVFITEGEPLK